MFKDEWLHLPKYSSWLKKASKCTEFRCHLCETTCKLSDLGSAALDSHARGQKHQARVQSKEKSELFFVKPQASSKQAESSPSASKLAISELICITSILQPIMAATCRSHLDSVLLK